jgi:hypothetical protein
MIRLQQYNGSMAPVEYALDPATGFFLEQLGVTDIICHAKRSDPHFSRQLGVVEGERLELYTVEGLPVDADKDHTIAAIVAEEDADAIVLADGTILDFGFLGTPPGIGVITVAPAADAEAENNAPATGADVEADEVEAFPAFDESLLPAALVEEIPTEERMYSDTIQRTDMFTSLFMDIPKRKQKDPKVMARLYRITDLLLALKNSVVVRDKNMAIVLGEQESYTAETVEEALYKQPTGAPIPALLPVAAVKRVIYTDDVSDALEDKGDVESRSDMNSLLGMLTATSAYNSAEGAGNPFVSYVNTLMKAVEVFKASASGDQRITKDQDVLRTHLPSEPVTGLKKVPEEELFADRYLGDVDNRMVRLLSSSRIKNPVTGTNFLVAPADTGETVGHVILDPALAEYRAPTRSSVLLWDIQASDASRRMTTLFQKALMENLEDQILLTDDDGDTSLAEQLELRLTPHMNLINHDSTRVLDSLGLRPLELSGDQFAQLAVKLEEGRNAWDGAHKALSAAATARASAKTTVAIKGIVDAESALLSEATLTEETLKPVTEAIGGGVAGSTLEGYDLLYANDLIPYANYTLGPYYLNVANGGPDVEYLEKKRTDYLSENARLTRNRGTARAISVEFQSEPELIDCPHVDDLEKVYNIQELDKRMFALNRIVKKYNGGQNGNYIECGTCGNHLICKHELLLLNEFLHPGRAVALHKALLLEFGNGVFEGSYICKNCGQKISDLEYDTHIEFDDEGRPLMGRSVIENNNEESDVVVIADETDSAIPFTDKTDRSLYKLARTLFERIGLQPTEEMYKRVVPAARKYLETMVANEKKYNRARDKAIAERKPVPVEYSYYFADAQAGILGALVLLEFQTSSIEVPLPIPGVEFSREGFPLDGDDWNVVGMAALNYVSFGLAGLFINTAPWKDTTWSQVSAPKKRIAMTKTAIVNGLYAVLAMPSPAIPAPLPLGAFTDKYKKRIAEWREKKRQQLTGTTAVATASSADRLPSMFRPLNRLVAPPAAPAIGNKATFLEQVEHNDFSVVAPAVQERSHVMSQQIMNDFHRAATASAIVIAGSPRSDSVCCFARLGEVAKAGFGVASLGLGEGVAEELALHGAAERILKARDPAAAGAGTHIYVPWSAPYSQTVLPAPKEEDYYKLFLKNCFEGSNTGLPHEYSPDYVCRHCGFECPPELFYPRGAEIPLNLDDKKRAAQMEAINTQYEELARTALAERVTINEERFRALEDRVRERRMVPPIPVPVVVPFLDRLASMAGDLGELLPSATTEWTAMSAIFAEFARVDTVEEDARRAALAEFAGHYDATLAALRAALTANVGEKERVFVENALGALGRMTENPVGAVNARNVLQLFVVYGEQIADNYNNRDPKPSKWFVKISRSHEELIQKIWNSVAEITTTAITGLSRLDESVNNTVKLVLRRFTAWLGRWMDIWINEFRPGPSASEKELTLLLRWTVVNGLMGLLTRTSPLYKDSVSPSARSTTVKFLSTWILDALVTAGQRVDTYQLTAEQIQQKLNERSEAERAAFLRKFDELTLEDRKVELIKKKLKIGDWSVGATRNLFAYDADMFEFERAQRTTFGVPDFDDTITGVRGGAGAERGAELYGFSMGAAEQVDMNNHLLTVDDGEGDERY